MADENREWTAADLARAIPGRQRRRMMNGELRKGDIAALRQFVGMSQPVFASALGISVSTLRNWEQGRRDPEGPALALLRIVARHPNVLQPDLSKSA